jgi:hypothetical protein
MAIRGDEHYSWSETAEHNESFLSNTIYSEALHKARPFIVQLADRARNPEDESTAALRTLATE